MAANCLPEARSTHSHNTGTVKGGATSPDDEALDGLVLGDGLSGGCASVTKTTTKVRKNEKTDGVNIEINTWKSLSACTMAVK